jgi:hypothetical protein
LLEGQRLMNELPWPPIDMLCPECQSPLAPNANGSQYHCTGSHCPHPAYYRGILGDDQQCHTVQCLICEERLVTDCHDFVYDGGRIEIEFGYGSNFDQGKGFGGSHGDPNDKLLSADQIEGYICDSCFDKKRKLLRGFKVTKQIVRNPV